MRFRTADRQQRRTARAQRDRLRHELGEYRTDAERREILAIISRHDEAAAAPLRKFIA